MTFYRIIFLGIVVMASIAGAAGGGENASPPAGASLENLRREAETVRRSIQDREAEIDRITRREGMSAILVEQNPQKILPVTDRAMILERGAVVHEGASAALRGDSATLETYLGVTEGTRRGGKSDGGPKKLH